MTTQEKEINVEKVMSMPLQGIKEPCANDVLCGRGGGTNNHPGNKMYRALVQEKYPLYARSSRVERGVIAAETVSTWRKIGRFLKKNGNFWDDVGDRGARDKTSQLFREQKVLRQKKIKLDQNSSGKEETLENTIPLTEQEQEKSCNEKAQLTIEQTTLVFAHTFGTEQMSADEMLTLDGFEWCEGLIGLDSPHFNPIHKKAIDSCLEPYPVDFDPPHIIVPTAEDTPFTAGVDQCLKLSHADSHQELPPMGSPQRLRWQGDHEDRRLNLMRDHSLSGFSLPDTSIVHPAAPFESRRSGIWSANPSLVSPSSQPPDHYPNCHDKLLQSQSLDLPMINDNVNQESVLLSPTGPEYEQNPSFNHPATVLCTSVSTLANIDCHVSNEAASDSSNGQTYQQPSPSSVAPRKVSDMDPTNSMSLSSVTHMDPTSLCFASWSSQGTSSCFPHPCEYFAGHNSDPCIFTRPEMFKRTSSLSQTDDEGTQEYVAGSVKRVALNRDYSATSNALKARYPSNKSLEHHQLVNKRQVSIQEMDLLNNTLEQSTLNCEERPKLLNERAFTFDNIMSEITEKPPALRSINRVSTLDALALDLGIGIVSCNDDDDIVWRQPTALGVGDRISTLDYFQD